MPKYRNHNFNGPPPDLDSEAARRQMLADVLMQSAMTPRQHPQGRIVANTGAADAITQVMTGLAARHAQKKADAATREQQNQDRVAFGLPPLAEPETRASRKNRALADALAGRPSSPDQMGPPEPEQGPPEPQRQTMSDLGIGAEAALHLYRNNPELYWRMYQAHEAQRAPQTLSAGAQLVNPETGEVIADNPSAGGGFADSSNVQSTVILDNGNIGIVRRNGTVEDTGRKASDRYQFLEGEGGDIRPANVRTGQAGPPIITAEDATRDAATRKGMEAESEAQARERVKVENEVPNDLATLDEQIRKTTEVLNRFQRGDFQTGPIAGRFPAVTTAGQDLESYIGEDVINRISQATFGALSEGERAFLKSSGMNRGNTEAANMSILERRLTSLENAKRAASGRLRRVQRGEGATGSGTDVTQMSDDELRRLISGD